MHFQSSFNTYLQYFIILVTSLLFSGFAAASETFSEAELEAIDQIKNNLTLTKEEKDWLAKHPTIKVGIDAGYAPYSFLDRENHFVGVAPDFLRILSEALEIELKPVADLTWPEILSEAKSTSLDVIATAVSTPERQAYLNFSQIYIPTPLVIMARNGEESELQSPQDLSGKKVALVGEYSSSKRVIKEHPDIIQHLVESPLEGLQAVASGEAQAYIGVLGVNYHLAQQHGLSNLVIAGRYDLQTNGQRLGIRKDWPELQMIFDKALGVMSNQSSRQIMEKWIPISISEATIISDNAPTITWTDEEIDWLAAHPDITIGIMNAWPPMDYVDEKKRPKGIGVSFIDAINKRLNGALTIVPGDWNTIYDGVKSKKLDALMDITPRESREAFFNFTDPYVNVPHAIFRRRGDPFAGNLGSLAGKTIAAEKGFFIHQVIRDNYPKLTTIEYDNTSDALDAVIKGKADAYVGNRAVTMYIIHNELIANLEEHGKIKETSSVNAIGVRKDWPILRDILQKALSNITIKERLSILKDWVKPVQEADSASIELSPAEWSWLEKHPVITVAGDANWAPVEYMGDDGTFKGISVEYINMIANMLGVRFEYRPSLNWHEATEKVKRRELDIFAAAAETTDRRSYASFTAPYLTLPAMVFTHHDVPYISSLAELEGKKVTIVRGHAISEIIRRDGWDIELHEVATIEDGLQALQDREAFAYIGNILVTSYVIRNEGLSNIRISGQTPYQLGMSMGVRSDWPELKSILNKALMKISNEQRSQVAARWIGLQVKEAPNYLPFWQALIWGGVLLALFFIWNRYLRSKNKQQSKEIVRQNKVLNLSRTSLNNAQRIAKLGSWHWQIDQPIFHWSEELLRIFGHPHATDHKGYTSSGKAEFIQAIHPDDRQQVNQALTKACQHRIPFSIESRIVRPDKDIRLVSIQGEVTLDKLTGNLEMNGTVLDITERKATEREVQKLFQALEQSPLSMMITATDGAIEYVNPCFTEITGYESGEVIGRNPSFLNPRGTGSMSYKDMWESIKAGKVWRGEYKNQRKNGELYWVRSTIAPVIDEQGSIINFIGLNQDISRQKATEERLFTEVNYSQLTKQPNRYFMLSQIERNILTATPFSLLMVDLANLKRINDSLGVEAGDRMIKQAGKHLDSLVDKTRTVAHLGGGQFLLMAEESTAKSAEFLISCILSAFRKPFEVLGEHITQNVNIGIALYPNDGNTAEELVSKAHVAANQAKRSGHFTYAFYAEKYNKDAQSLLFMENQLRHAIDKDELSVFCQPKVDAHSGKFLGAEALLRWDNNELGSVRPDIFIPIAEESDCILAIGRWVIEESCRQTLLWREAGFKEFTIAINMSPKQFLDKDIAPFIAQCIDDHGLEGSQVEIEVTEGLFIEAGDAIHEQVAALKAIGITLALDDFGTGYSSLQYLRNYPFDTLKIDRSFVRELPESQGDASLVRAITAMGRALGMKIVAEGVEEVAQATFLTSEGCDIFQGYLYGKPMSERDFLSWLYSSTKNKG